MQPEQADSQAATHKPEQAPLQEEEPVALSFSKTDKKFSILVLVFSPIDQSVLLEFKELSLVKSLMFSKGSINAFSYFLDIRLFAEAIILYSEPVKEFKFPLYLRLDISF